MFISWADNEVVCEFSQLLSPANHVRINSLIRLSHQLRLHYHVSLLQVSDDVKLRHSDVLFAASHNCSQREKTLRAEEPTSAILEGRKLRSSGNILLLTRRLRWNSTEEIVCLTATIKTASCNMFFFLHTLKSRSRNSEFGKQGFKQKHLMLYY